jgi:hypothetical protein
MSELDDDSDLPILFALTPMLFFLSRLLLLYLLCTNPFIAVCDESCVDQGYFSGYGFELRVVPVVRRVFGAYARCDYASYLACSFRARWVSPLSRARVGQRQNHTLRPATGRPTAPKIHNTIPMTTRMPPIVYRMPIPVR